MHGFYWIAMDVHCAKCELISATPGGRVRSRWTAPTALPALVEGIRSVPRPRAVVMEEGPLAGWLYRALRPEADHLIACDPRRNHLIANDGDKDDPIDAEKLLRLAIGGFLRPVHHRDEEHRAIFKQHVALYHDRVGLKVAEAQRLIWLLRQWGVIVREKHFADPADRPALRDRLPAGRTMSRDLGAMFDSYDAARERADRLRKELIRQARRIEPVRRFTDLPGVSWVRAATFYAYIDTPFRFRNRSALWKYMGIGLQRRSSGDGPPRLRVPKRFHRPLKDMIHGAANSAVASGNNPFADEYRRHLHEGRSPHIARRNVARSLAAVMWGMFKSGSAYRPERVGRPAQVSAPRRPQDATSQAASRGSSPNRQWAASPRHLE